MVLGNVNRQSIEDIWNGPAYKEARRRFLGGRMFEVCSRQCPVLKGWKDFERIDWFNKLPHDSDAYRNAALNADEIRDGKTVLDSMPRWLRFSSSYACNLSCYHCFQRQDRISGLRLPQSFFENVKAVLKYTQILFFYGGEPLIDRDNLLLMEHMASRAYPVKIFMISNGTVLNESIRSLMRRLNLAFIDVSIDSIDDALYAELRRPAKLSETIEHVNYFSSILKEKGGELFFSMTINRKNYGELLSYARFAVDHGAKPFFQFAHNAFNDKSFGSEYEIRAARDFRGLRKSLLDTRDFAESSGLPLTVINIDQLLPLSNYYIAAAKRAKGFAFKALARAAGSALKKRG